MKWRKTGWTGAKHTYDHAHMDPSEPKPQEPQDEKGEPQETQDEKGEPQPAALPGPTPRPDPIGPSQRPAPPPEQTITLDRDLPGLGKQGQQIPVSRMMEWSAEKAAWSLPDAASDLETPPHGKEIEPPDGSDKETEQ